MDIEIQKEEKKNDSPIIGVYNIKLKIGDGVRFGFGFGLGMIFWGLIFLGISLISMGLLVKSQTESLTNSILGTPNDIFIQSIMK